MAGEKNAIDIIDKALETTDEVFKRVKEVLTTARSEVLNLETEKKQAEEEKSKLEEHEAELEASKTNLEEIKKQLEEETKKLEQDKKERDQKIGAMTEEQMRLLDEYEKVKVELKKFAQAAAEQEEMELNFDKIQALLSIYRVLIEEIWQGHAHYRILHVLHGDKEEMNREELKNSTGVGGAFVLRSVQELARVGLLEYDENSGTAKLKKRLFPKKAIES